jgi:ABC-2 type transport system permease protein
VAAVVEAARRAGELDAPPSEDDEAAGREGAVADAGEPNARTRGDDEAAGADPIAGPERDAVAAADDGPDGVAARARDVPAPVRPPDAGADVFLEETPGERATLPTPLQQTVPGWSLFAMFFIVVPLSHALHRERAEGTVRRILALAVPRSAIVAGKLVPYVLVGTVQFAGMLAVGLWVVPMLSDLSLELGLHPEVLLPITFACALAATSYALVVATLARTPEQAAAFGATSVVVLAVIGGVMVPHFVMPAFLQKIALASPLYWGHQAYLDAFLHGATLADLATPLAVLTAFALVCLAVATPRVGRA